MKHKATASTDPPPPGGAQTLIINHGTLGLPSQTVRLMVRSVDKVREYVMGFNILLRKEDLFCIFDIVIARTTRTFLQPEL